MGSIVRFQPKDESASAKTEAILSKIGELYQRKMRAKEELPVALAQLVGEGRSAFVLDAVRRWGTGETEPHEILQECHDETTSRG